MHTKEPSLERSMEMDTYTVSNIRKDGNLGWGGNEKVDSSYETMRVWTKEDKRLIGAVPNGKPSSSYLILSYEKPLRVASLGPWLLSSRLEDILRFMNKRG